MSYRLIVADVLEGLAQLGDESVQCVVTSPPYWGLRDYGMKGQIGLEPTPAAYLERMVAVFAEVRRVLRKDGTLWLNMGDCYATGAGRAFSPGGGDQGERFRGDQGERFRAMGAQVPDSKAPNSNIPVYQPNRMPIDGLKPKDLLGMPWRLAFALQADGWWLRSDIIWAKPNPMPESVTDRPTKAHEYVFLLTKAARYFYDAEAIREGVTGGAHSRGDGVNPKARWKTPDGWDTTQGDGGHGSFHRNGREAGRVKQNESFSAAVSGLVGERNARSVWTIATAPFPEAHFATFPPELARRCIAAGSRLGDAVLDPFAGAGTTLWVAEGMGRDSVGIELNPAYAEMAERRLKTSRWQPEGASPLRIDPAQTSFIS